MRYEFIVEEAGGRWSVRRGSTSPLWFDTEEKATKAAENMAASASRNGDHGVVMIAREGDLDEHRSFAPAEFHEVPVTPTATARPPAKKAPARHLS